MQKIALFLNFFGKKAEKCLFWALLAGNEAVLWHITRDLMCEIRAPNGARRCIARTALRIMRAYSPARLVELLRRDVFALKICAHYACAALRAHFKGGLRSKPPGIRTYTYTHEDMYELATKAARPSRASVLLDLKRREKKR